MFDGWIGTFTNLLQNPFFLILAVIFAIVIIFGLIKKVFKLVLLILAAFVLYVVYLLWTGQDIPTSVGGIKDSVEETISRSKENVKETGEGIKDAAYDKSGEIINEKMRETIEDTKKETGLDD